MALNKKSQWIFVGIMVFVMAFIMLVQFIAPIKDQITIARNDTNLNCSSTDITTGRRMTCIAVDTSLFYFIGIGIAAAAGYLGVRTIKYKFSPPQQ